jgi:hypothetical protein
VKTWRPWPDDCNHCGGALEILTDETRDDWGFDGDELRCSECKCPGYLAVCAVDDVCSVMHDEPVCDCEWCNTHPQEEEA